MIWKKCYLYGKVKTGEDVLGNSIDDWELVKETKARNTPWVSLVLTLENRKVTKNEQCFMIPIPYKSFPVCQRAEIDGVTQDIVESIDLSPRYTVIRVKVYKQ